MFAFVLVTAYQSVLISYILAPEMELPIVDSLTDVAIKTDVQLVVDKGMGADSFFTVNKVTNCSIIVRDLILFNQTE